MILTIEAVQREDGRCALFHGDQFIGHLRMDATGTIGGIPLPPDIAGLLEQRSETVGRMITIPRRPAKKRASSRPALRPVKKRPNRATDAPTAPHLAPKDPDRERGKAPEAGKPGRRPVPWHCRECGNDTTGPECGFCGEKRPPLAERQAP